MSITCHQTKYENLNILWHSFALVSLSFAASVMGRVSVSYFAPYNVGKFAVEAFSDGLRYKGAFYHTSFQVLTFQKAQFQVFIHVIGKGKTKTDFLKHFISAFCTPPKKFATSVNQTCHHPDTRFAFFTHAGGICGALKFQLALSSQWEHELPWWINCRKVFVKSLTLSRKK